MNPGKGCYLNLWGYAYRGPADLITFASVNETNPMMAVKHRIRWPMRAVIRQVGEAGSGTSQTVGMARDDLKGIDSLAVHPDDDIPF